MANANFMDVIDSAQRFHELWRYHEDHDWYLKIEAAKTRAESFAKQRANLTRLWNFYKKNPKLKRPYVDLKYATLGVKSSPTGSTVSSQTTDTKSFQQKQPFYPNFALYDPLASGMINKYLDPNAVDMDLDGYEEHLDRYAWRSEQVEGMRKRYGDTKAMELMKNNMPELLDDNPAIFDKIEQNLGAVPGDVTMDDFKEMFAAKLKMQKRIDHLDRYIVEGASGSEILEYQKTQLENALKSANTIDASGRLSNYGFVTSLEADQMYAQAGNAVKDIAHGLSDNMQDHFGNRYRNKETGETILSVADKASINILVREYGMSEADAYKEVSGNSFYTNGFNNATSVAELAYHGNKTSKAPGLAKALARPDDQSLTMPEVEKFMMYHIFKIRDGKKPQKPPSSGDPNVNEEEAKKAKVTPPEVKMGGDGFDETGSKDDTAKPDTLITPKMKVPVGTPEGTKPPVTPPVKTNADDSAPPKKKITSDDVTMLLATKGFGGRKISLTLQGHIRAVYPLGSGPKTFSMTEGYYRQTIDQMLQAEGMDNPAERKQLIDVKLGELNNYKASILSEGMIIDPSKINMKAYERLNSTGANELRAALKNIPRADLASKSKSIAEELGMDPEKIVPMFETVYNEMEAAEPPKEETPETPTPTEEQMKLAKDQQIVEANNILIKKGNPEDVIKNHGEEIKNQGKLDIIAATAAAKDKAAADKAAADEAAAQKALVTPPVQPSVVETKIEEKGPATQQEILEGDKTTNEEAAAEAEFFKGWDPAQVEDYRKRTAAKPPAPKQPSATGAKPKSAEVKQPTSAPPTAPPTKQSRGSKKISLKKIGM